MQPRRRRRSEIFKNFLAAAAGVSGIFKNFSMFYQKIEYKSVFLKTKHFTDVGNYFRERRRTSLLYFVKIHHHIRYGVHSAKNFSAKSFQRMQNSEKQLSESERDGEGKGAK